MIDNVNAIRGIKKILIKLTDNEVLTLSGTITQGLLKKKISSVRTAVDLIIRYSADPSSFLRRKLITKQHLFDYLVESGISITLPASKDELADRILEHWENDSQTILPDERGDSNNEESDQSKDNLQVATKESRSAVNATDLELMSLQFSEWFYNLLNTQPSIGEEHFYPDARIKVHLINQEMTVIEEATNAAEVIKLLRKIKQDYNIYFKPNLLNNGRRAKMDSYGLVLVLCCGTLHIDNNITGVFEQMFGLAQDPQSDNNWKIKTSQLVLRSKCNVETPPELCDNVILCIDQIQ